MRLCTARVGLAVLAATVPHGDFTESVAMDGITLFRIRKRRSSGSADRRCESRIVVRQPSMHICNGYGNSLILLIDVTLRTHQPRMATERHLHGSTHDPFV